MTSKRATALIIVLALCLIIAGCARASIAGIDQPINVSGSDIQLVSAGYNANMIVFGGKALVIEAEILSGDSDLSKMEVWLTDSAGNKSTPGMVLTGMTNDNKRVISWKFDVKENAKGLTLHLPEEKTVVVDSLIKN